MLDGPDMEAVNERTVGQQDLAGQVNPEHLLAILT